MLLTLFFIRHVGKKQGLSKSFSSIIDQYSVMKGNSVTDVPFYCFFYDDIDLEGSDQ